MTTTWYEIIKEQWDWGCYTSRDQLDIYVNCGWITADQADEIAGVGKYAKPATPDTTTPSDSTVPDSGETSTGTPVANQ